MRLFARSHREIGVTLGFQDSHIYSFYETDNLPTAQEGEPGEWTLSGRSAVLVDRYSVRSGRSWEATVAIEGTHQRMLFVHLYHHHDLSGSNLHAPSASTREFDNFAI